MANGCAMSEASARNLFRNRLRPLAPLNENAAY